MSFNPPRKSAYGDELVDDIDGNLSQKTSFSPPPTTDRPTSYNLHQETQTSTNPPATGLPAITQEDMIFIRSWQHDSYIKRGRYSKCPCHHMLSEYKTYITCPPSDSPHRY